MKFGIAISTLTGLGALIALLVYNDAAAVFGTVVHVGWGLALVVAVRGCILVLAGIGWAKLVRPFALLKLRVYLLLRWIRESINVLLPVAQVGGDLMGGRLLTFWGISGGLAGASIFADLAIQLATQFVFTLIGFAMFALTVSDSRTIHYVTGGLALSAAALSGFYLFQRAGLLRILERMRIYAARRWPSLAIGEDAWNLHENVQAIYGQMPSLLASFAFHQMAWLLGVLEIWIALDSIGLKPGWGECLVLESLGQAVRSADFAVPGVMGVQEGGFLVIGGLYGIRPEVSLALSLVKRVPDLALGIPGLLGWLSLEAARSTRTRAVLRAD